MPVGRPRRRFFLPTLKPVSWAQTLVLNSTPFIILQVAADFFSSSTGVGVYTKAVGGGGAGALLVEFDHESVVSTGFLRHSCLYSGTAYGICTHSQSRHPRQRLPTRHDASAADRGVRTHTTNLLGTSFFLGRCYNILVHIELIARLC